MIPVLFLWIYILSCFVYSLNEHWLNQAFYWFILQTIAYGVKLNSYNLRLLIYWWCVRLPFWQVIELSMVVESRCDIVFFVSLTIKMRYCQNWQPYDWPKIFCFSIFWWFKYRFQLSKIFMWLSYSIREPAATEYQILLWMCIARARLCLLSFRYWLFIYYYYCSASSVSVCVSHRFFFNHIPTKSISTKSILISVDKQYAQSVGNHRVNKFAKIAFNFN